MKATVRRRISMARRALDFAAAHPLTDQGFTSILTRLKDELGRADQLGTLQSLGRTHEKGATRRRATLRQQIRSRQLRRLIKIAVLASTDHPELAGKMVLPRRTLPNREFVLKARGLLADATEYKDVLTSLGLGDTFITDLSQALDTLDSITEEAHAARADHVGATAELNNLATRAVSDVALLDTYYQTAFASDEQTLSAWRSASNIAGPFITKPEPEPAPSPSPSPTPIPVIGPGPATGSAPPAVAA